MASKKSFQLDDFGFDGALDSGDFDYGEPHMGKPRHPITKVGKSLARGAKQGLMDEYFIRRTIKDALPRGYGQALDLADDATSTLKNLYNTTATELRPAIREMKRSVDKIIPLVEKRAPKSIVNRLKKWAKDEDKAAYEVQEDFREGQINAAMAETFAYQIESTARRNAELDARDDVKQNIALDQHKNMMAQLGAMSYGIQQLSNYTTKVTANYQRRSLELQYRSYFIARDQLEEQKKSHAEMLTQLKGILNNTGLPDTLKYTEGERLHEMMRNRFLGSIGNTLFDSRTGFVKRLGENLVKTAKTRARTFADTVRSASMASDSLVDVNEMMQGMGPEAGGFGDIAGEMGGSIAAQGLAGKMGRWLGQRARKNPKIQTGGNWLRYNLDNLPGRARTWAQGYDHEDNVAAPLVRFLKDAILQDQGPSRALQVDTLRNIQEPAAFNRQARKSITEIIPGYLARIFRELQWMRTGDTKIDLTSYDYHQNRFVDKREARATAFKKVFKDYERQSTTESVDALVDKLDPQKKLTPEQRKLLGEQLLRDNVNERGGDYKRYTNPMNYTGKAARHSIDYADLFNEHFKDDHNWARREEFGRLQRGLGTSVGDSRADIQDLANAGYLDWLRESGLVSPDGSSINLSKLYDYHYSADPFDAEPESGAPGAQGSASVKEMLLRRRKPRGGMSFKRQPDRLNVRLPRRVEQERMQEWAERMRNGGAGGQSVSSSDRLIKAIQDASSRASSEASEKILTRIEAIIQKGISLNVSRNRAADTGSSARQRPAFFDRTLGEHLSDAWGLGGRMVGGARDRLKETQSRLRGVMRDGFGLAGKGLGWATGKFNEIKDIYVDGDVPGRVRLEAWRMQAGEYFDEKTHAVIQKLKDIKGNVVDKDGKVVLKADEIKKAFVRSNAGKKLITSLGASFNTAKELFSKGITGGFGLVGGVYGSALRYGMKAYQHLAAQDVYVMGQEEPALFARLMRAGVYRSKTTGKTIQKPSDIDGPVELVKTDGSTEEQLTLEQLKGGLFDQHGKKLQTPVMRLLNTGKALVSGVFNRMKQGVQGVADFLKGGFSKFGNLFKSDGITFSGSKTIVERLTEIRDLLDNRLPKRGKSALGLDEQGFQKNSFEDEELQKQAKAKAAENGSLKDAIRTGMGGGKSFYGSLLGGLSGLAGRFKKGGKGEGEDSSGGLTDTILGTAGGSLLGKFGRLGLKGLKGVGKYGWRGIKGLGGLALGKLGLSGAEAAASGLAGTGEAAAGAGVAAEGLGLGGLALSGLGAVGAGLLGIVSSPIVLSAAAVGGAAYGLHALYKHLTAKKLTPLSTMRYAQYGFPAGDSKHLNAVMGLEDQLSKNITYVKGIAQLSAKGLTGKALLAPFGIDQKDRNQVQNWVTWFTRRFKPVLVTHLTVLHRVSPSTKLADIENLKPAEKKEYLDGASFPGGPYDIFVSPFPDLKSLNVSRYEVTSAAQLAEKNIGSTLPIAAATTAAATLKKINTAGTSAAAQTGVPTSAQGAGRKPVGPSQISQMGAARAAAAAAATQGQTISGGGAASPVKVGAKLDTLSSLRFKTYGLKEMEVSKVSALMRLEEIVGKGLGFKDKKASWNGNIEQVCGLMGPAFNVKAPHTDEGYAWQSWFKLRFLPTYLAYATAMASATQQQNLKTAETLLRPDEAIVVGQAIIGAHSTWQGDTAVWNVPMSPWPAYALGSNVHITDPNMQVLNDTASRKILEEKNVPKSKIENALGKSSFDRAVNAFSQSKLGQAASKAASWVGGKISSAANTIKNVASAGAQAVGSVLSGNAKIAAADAMAGPAPSANTSWASSLKDKAGAMAGKLMGGRTVATDGKGSGGAVNQLPDPKGNGSWSALKDLILGAAKMVGVDGPLMGTMAAIESGFHYAASAGTSSAKGLYQFISSTWNTMLRKYGPKYGIAPGTAPTDPKANALMGAEYIKENSAILSKALNRPLTDTDLYFAHFLGPAGAVQLLKGNPSASAAALLPSAANANKPIFYNGGKPRTVAEVYQYVDGLVRNKGKQFGITGGGGDTVLADKGGKAGSDKAGMGAAAGGAGATLAAVAGKGAAGGAVAPGAGAALASTAGAGNAATPPTSANAKPLAIPVSDSPMGPGGPTGNADASSAMGGGPVTPALARGNDIQNQQAGNPAISAGALKDTNSILTQSLSVHQQILTNLQAILKVVGKNGGFIDEKGNVQQAGSNPNEAGMRGNANRRATMAAASQPQAMLAPILSMTKANFGNS